MLAFKWFLRKKRPSLQRLGGPNKILRIWRANNIWVKLQNAPCPLTIAVSKAEKAVEKLGGTQVTYIPGTLKLSQGLNKDSVSMGHDNHIQWLFLIFWWQHPFSQPEYLASKTELREIPGRVPKGHSNDPQDHPATHDGFMGGLFL